MRRLFRPKVESREADPLLRCWREIPLTMIDAVRSCEWGWRLPSANAHLDEVNRPVPRWRRKRQAVFMANELRDLGVRGMEFLFGRGEVGAATCGFSHALQQLIRSFELHRRLRRVCGRQF